MKKTQEKKTEGKAVSNKVKKNWNIIEALDFVLHKSEDCHLSDEFWKDTKEVMDFLTSTLNLTKFQIIALAIMIEEGKSVSWRTIGDHLGCSRITMMTYTEEIDELQDKGWIEFACSHEPNGMYDGFALTHGVITALRHNKVFVPEKFDGLTTQELMDKLEVRFDSIVNHRFTNYQELESFTLKLCKLNPQLPLCDYILNKVEDPRDKVLLMLEAHDYAHYAGTEDEGVLTNYLSNVLPEGFDTNMMIRKLRCGNHPLIANGIMEWKCEEGIVDSDRYLFTQFAKDEFFSDYVPSVSTNIRPNSRSSRNVKSHTVIKEKKMYYNSSEEAQIARLTDLLSQEKLPAIQDRLEQSGLRKGFACMFYGAPGTGKTETVLQIARQTGRDIMQIDIAGIRDKYVGESEKNIKGIFARYRSLCKKSDVMPILFFNEADALINKRVENINHSVDKMDNAMQNIILQEIEDLDGILIATSNLVSSNLDEAFERRFLFKVEFKKPNTEVKAKLWTSMLGDSISEDEAELLAKRYDFSGGQIENIVRQQTIDYILSGKKSSFDEIDTYCKREILVKKNERQSISGFAKA